MNATHVIYNGQSYPAKYASFDIAAAANSDVVAAVTGKRITVVGIWMGGASGTAATATFSSAATPLSPVVGVVAGGPTFAEHMILYQTVAGEKLNIAAATGGIWGRIKYIEADA